VAKDNRQIAKDALKVASSHASRLQCQVGFICICIFTLIVFIQPFYWFLQHHRTKGAKRTVYHVTGGP
jgi:hypothetical protein